MTSIGAEVQPQISSPAWSLAAKIQAFMEKRRQKPAGLLGESTANDEFTEDEISVLIALGELELSSTINIIYETDIDEVHLWEDRRGRVGIHTKRQDDFLDDTTRDTRAFVRFDKNGDPNKLHIQTQRLRRTGAEVVAFECEVAHLRLDAAGVADFVLEEIDDMGARLKDVTKQQNKAA